VFSDLDNKFETLQKEQNIKVNITPEEIIDALKAALRQNCKHYFLQSQLFENVRTMGYGHGWSEKVPPFPYSLEFVKDVNLFRVYSIKRGCTPNMDVSERSMQRITGRLECDYTSSIEVLSADESGINSDKRYTFITLVLFVLI
jgi:hypothetical protein